jgi:hypothetical protein
VFARFEYENERMCQEYGIDARDRGELARVSGNFNASDGCFAMENLIEARPGVDDSLCTSAVSLLAGAPTKKLHDSKLYKQHMTKYGSSGMGAGPVRRQAISSPPFSLSDDGLCSFDMNYNGLDMLSHFTGTADSGCSQFCVQQIQFHDQGDRSGMHGEDDIVRDSMVLPDILG